MVKSLLVETVSPQSLRLLEAAMISARYQAAKVARRHSKKILEICLHGSQYKKECLLTQLWAVCDSLWSSLNKLDTRLPGLIALAEFAGKLNNGFKDGSGEKWKRMRKIVIVKRVAALWLQCCFESEFSLAIFQGDQ